jgi:hypothetical protein
MPSTSEVMTGVSPDSLLSGTLASYWQFVRAYMLRECVCLLLLCDFVEREEEKRKKRKA